MIEAALKWFKENVNPQPDTIEIAGRQQLRIPGIWKEIRPDVRTIRAFCDNNSQALSIGTVASLIEFIKKHMDLKCQVVVSPGGCKAYFNIDESVPLSDAVETLLYVRVPFVHPAQRFDFGFVKFHDFLDQHRDGMEEYDALAKALREFKKTEFNQLTVKEVGPIINVQTMAKKDLEGSSCDIPKELTIHMPTGTREFLIPNIYLLRITPTEKDILFALTKKESDGSWDLLVSQAFDMLRTNLPGVLVLEGA